jgi:hypothetical protein
VSAVARWERRLEREGLGVVNYGPNADRRLSPEHIGATEEWLSWAREVEDSFPFTSYRQRRIWSLYAGSLPLTQINKLVGGSRRSITKAIHRITLANPPPVPNPWRKSGRDQTPLRLVPREDDDMPPETKTRPLLQYSKIKLKRNDGLTLPGNPREKDVLIDMQGRPTPWGIDLVLDGGVVLSLPAWKIDHAIQVPEGA